MSQTLRRIVLVTSTFIAVLSFGGNADANPIVVGGSSSHNCFPFSCAYLGISEYQQVYSSTAFGQAVSIDQMTFFELAGSGLSLEAGTFTFSLSYTSKAVNALSTLPSDNVGAGSTTVFNGSLPGLVSGELVIPFSAPFIYDPSLGNLLLTVDASGTSGGSGYLTADYSGAVTSRAYVSSTYGNVADPAGLTTEFAATAVPEPATLPLVLSGMLCLGFFQWRRKRTAAARAGR